MITTISEQECAIRAIIASEESRPGCNLERLKYADWLEEHGEQERADFIRQSCWDKHGGQYTGTAELVRLYRPFVMVPDCVPDDVALTVCRGFLDSVHVPTLEVWRGGKCGCCDGERVFPPSASGYAAVGLCLACKGEGRIPGIGRDLCRWNPVQEVRVGNKEPWRGYEWCNAERTDCDPNNHPQSDIPAPLFEIMERLGGYAGYVPGRWLNYSTGDANRYWSQALILEARQPNEVTE